MNSIKVACPALAAAMLLGLSSLCFADDAQSVPSASGDQAKQSGDDAAPSPLERRPDRATEERQADGSQNCRRRRREFAPRRAARTWRRGLRHGHQEEERRGVDRASERKPGQVAAKAERGAGAKREGQFGLRQRRRERGAAPCRAAARRPRRPRPHQHHHGLPVPHGRRAGSEIRGRAGLCVLHGQRDRASLCANRRALPVQRADRQMGQGVELLSRLQRGQGAVRLVRLGSGQRTPRLCESRDRQVHVRPPTA